MYLLTTSVYMSVFTPPGAIAVTIIFFGAKSGLEVNTMFAIND